METKCKRKKDENSREVIASGIHQNDWVGLQRFATLESHRQCDSNLHTYIHRQTSSIVDILMMIIQVHLGHADV